MYKRWRWRDSLWFPLHILPRSPIEVGRSAARRETQKHHVNDVLSVHSSWSRLKFRAITQAWRGKLYNVWCSQQAESREPAYKPVRGKSETNMNTPHDIYSESKRFAKTDHFIPQVSHFVTVVKSGKNNAISTLRVKLHS